MVTRTVRKAKTGIPKNAFTLLAWGVWLIWTLLTVLFLGRWQIFQGKQYKALADTIGTTVRFLDVPRGNIFTAQGEVVATDQRVWDVFISVIYPRDIQLLKDNLTKFLEYAKQLQVLDSKGIISILEYVQSHESIPYYVILKDLDDYKAQHLEKFVKENNIAGIYFRKKYKRFYPNGEVFSNIIGFVSNYKGQQRGLYGVEGFFWWDIAGRLGEIQKQESVTGEVLLGTKYKLKNLKVGKNIVLTINSTVQRKITKLLAQGVKEYNAKGGVVIVMEPSTGYILGMASYPTYDSNRYWEIKDYSVFANKAVSYVYEFGSVQKPLTLAMALDAGKIKENFQCYDSGVLKVLDKKIYNWEYKRYGLLDITGILRYSDNVCAATVGLKLEPQTFVDYLYKLGFGAPTNIGIFEEQTGVIKSPQKWNKVDLAVASFGQMITATPLQVISAHSTIANNGVRMQPLLVKQIYDDQESIEFKPTVAARVFKEDVAKFIKNAMIKATAQVGFNRYIPGYSIAGKTGSAQIPRKDGPGYKKDAVNATFVAFAPAKDPKMIMLVLLIEPEKGKLASYTAVPLWIKIFKEIKDDLGVTPD